MRKRALAVLLLLALPAGASKRHVPMGDAIRAADVIAIADISASVLHFREILKGDASLRGQKRELPFSPMRMEVYVPPEAKGVAVLMQGPDVHELYREPHELEALRELIPIVGLPTERQRLTRLRDAALRNANPILRRQLLTDLRAMREPSSYPLLLELFPRLDEKGQREVIEIIAFIGDPRGVPTLVQALGSKHPWVAQEAANVLTSHFPSAPGAPPRRPFREPPQTPFLRMLGDAKALETAVWMRTDWVERSIEEHRAEGARVRAALLPVLTRYAKTGHHLQKNAAARVLRALRHPETAEALLALLDNSKEPAWTSFILDPSTRIAAYALADLGGAAREAAFAELSTRPDWEEYRGAIEPAGAPDEIPTLLRTLQRLHTDPKYDTGRPANWILYRLGSLKAKRAVPAIVRALDRRPWDLPTIVEALVAIGGPEVEAGMQPYLRAKDREVRRAAMEVLFKLQGPRFLPALRLMLTDRTLGEKSTALTYLAHLGEPRDLAVLVPQSDFWTGDRENHYWLMMAIAEIRRRHAL